MSSRSPLTNTELSRSARLHGICIAILLIAFATTNAVKAATVVWSNAAASTAWYTNTNWTANTSSTQWTTSDIAQFANAGTATTAGINMGTSALSIGAIEITSARTRALTIGNSSATSGNLTLNATTVNGVSNVIVRNASGSALTIQNNETGTGKTMDVALSNNADNKIMVDGAGGVVISSIIKSVSGSTPLTIAGSGTGSVTLSGANTYAGGTTLNAGNIVLGNAAGLSTGTLTVGLGSNLDAGTGYTGGTTGNRNTKAMLNTVALTGAVTVANNIVLPADTVLNTRTIYAKGSSGNSTRFTGDISGGSANLSLFLNSDGANNAGIFRFSGNNTFVTSSDTGANSGINLNRGSLQIDSNAALGADTNSLFMDSYTGQQLIFTSGFTYTHPTTLESGVQTIFVSNGAAGSQLDITAPLGGGDSTSSLRLTSGTSGDKTTTYRLAGTNTLSGKIELYRGAVIITNNNSLGNAALQLNGNNNTTLGDVRFENSVTLANNIELVNTANPDPIHTGGNTVVLNGVVSSTGTAALVKIGAGTLVLGGNNTYSVGTVVNAGVLRINGVSSLPTTTALTLNGGVLGLGVADFTRALGTAAGQVQFTGSGGFAAYGADRNVNLGGASAQVTWGSGSFVPAGSALILGAADATNKVTFQNPIDFGGATRTIQVVKGSGGATYDAELSGSLSNGSYTQTGDGTLRISGPVGGTAYTQNAAGTLNVESVISTTTFTQSGSGSAVSVSGGGSIASPTANFNAGATQLGNAGINTAVTSPNIVIGGGSLVIAGSEQIADTSNVSLNSGSFGFNGAGKRRRCLLSPTVAGRSSRVPTRSSARGLRSLGAAESTL